MPWGGSYSGMDMTGVTVIELAPAGDIPGTHTVDLGTDEVVDGVNFGNYRVDTGLHHFEWDVIADPQNAGTAFPVTITAKDGAGATVTGFSDTVDLSGWAGGAGVLYSADFEDGDGGWTATASWDSVGDWQWGTPSSGPGAAFSGENVWATNLHGNYTDSGGTNYLSQTFDFSGVFGLELSWQQWVEVFYSYDTAETYVNGDLVYSRTSSSPTSGYEEVVVDLSAYDNLADVEIVFALYATTVVSQPGWYIDDVVISADATPVPISPTVTGEFVDGVWTGSVTVLAAADEVMLCADDGNGHSGFSNTFTVLPHQSQTDLLWNELTADAGAVHPGETLSVTRDYQVAETAVGPDFEIEYHLSTDAIWGNSDDYILTPNEWISTTAGKSVGSHSGTAALTVPSSVPPGDYTLLAKLDARFAVSESDEDNNVRVGPSVPVVPEDQLRPTAEIVHPAHNGSIELATINGPEKYIDVTFRDEGDSGINPLTITDAAHEFTLTGSGVAAATVISGVPMLVDGTTYRYFCDGVFGSGEVTVHFTGARGPTMPGI